LCKNQFVKPEKRKNADLKKRRNWLRKEELKLRKKQKNCV